MVDKLRPRVVDALIRVEAKSQFREKAGSQSKEVELWRDRIPGAFRAKQFY